MPSARLVNFLTHKDSSYHANVLKVQAPEITRRLSEWFNLNRRKLPWRGDEEPEGGWDGRGGLDGGGLVKEGGGAEGKKQKEAKKQKTLHGFFKASSPPPSSSTSTSKSPSSATAPEAPPTPAAPIPVTPYSVWISETMLQQTRVSAVVPFYLRWMSTLPTVQHLAAATDDEVNGLWAGLGFYRRARNLQKGAKHVVAEFDGSFPAASERLETIPGIGPYTAAAVASICHGERRVAVDGNVLRGEELAGNV